MNGIVKAVSSSETHTMRKTNRSSIKLVAGMGVEGDAHMGRTVKHRSRVAKDPTQPNLRQVHLIHSELHNELQDKGFSVSPGEMGENITTSKIDLLNLPTNTKLHFGQEVIIKITGLRNPCHQLDGIQPGLMKAVLEKTITNHVIRKSGIMAIVINGGTIRTGDTIQVELPAEPHIPLEKV